MVEIYFDSSFLVPFYVEQKFSNFTIKTIESEIKNIKINSLQRHEVKNAARALLFRKVITLKECDNVLSDFDSDLKNIFSQQMVEWEKVFAEAESIGRKHTSSFGIRSFDLLHLAIARAQKAKKFATYDKVQAGVASKLGFEVITAN